MKKRILALLMATVMIVSLTACSGGASNTVEAPAGEATEKAPAGDEVKAPAGETSEAPATGGGDNKLTVWCWDPAFNIYAMEEAAKEYKKTNPDFELEIVEIPWQDLQTKLTTAATSNDLASLPDILLMQDNAFQKNVLVYPEAFTDITNSGINFGDFAEAKTAYSVVDGKNYGVPFDNGAAVVAYRTDVLEEAGFTLDDFTDITWDEYIEKGKVVLEKTGKPLNATGAGESDMIMMMLQSAGSSLFDTEGNPAMVGNADLEKTMQTYMDLKNSGVMVEVNDWDQYISTFINGTLAGTINGCWILGSVQVAEDQAGLWGVTNLPSLVGTAGATNYSNNGGSSWAVTSNCQDTELAYDFLAKTFAGSVEFYETILPSSGAIGTYIPAGDSSVYSEPQEFFGGQAIYALITDFAAKTPSNNTGIYYYEARDAVATAIQNVANGADIQTEIQAAQDMVEFQMSE